MKSPLVRKYLIHRFLTVGLLLIMLGGVTSCGIYRKRILFSTDRTVPTDQLRIAVAEASRNYTIRANDYLEVDVSTNQGEILIDPNQQIAREIGMGQQNQGRVREEPQYLVRANGKVNLPVVGDVTLAGLTLYQADSVLAERYATLYQEPYVITRYVNKRVVVLGTAVGQVIPLQNENTNLIEVLALAGGITNQARTDNIRLIRGDLDDPQVQVIDLSTIQGMQAASLKVQSGDIIYVQPVQRVVAEAIRDISPILSLVTSVVTLIVLFNRLDN